jgi:hypothetical protein
MKEQTVFCFWVDHVYCVGTGNILMWVCEVWCACLKDELGQHFFNPVYGSYSVQVPAHECSEHFHQFTQSLPANATICSRAVALDNPWPLPLKLLQLRNHEHFLRGQDSELVMHEPLWNSLFTVVSFWSSVYDTAKTWGRFKFSTVSAQTSYTVSLCTVTWKCIRSVVRVSGSHGSEHLDLGCDVMHLWYEGGW